MHVFYDRRTSAAATCDSTCTSFVPTEVPVVRFITGISHTVFPSTAIEIEKRPIPSALGS